MKADAERSRRGLTFFGIARGRHHVDTGYLALAADFEDQAAVGAAGDGER